MNNHNRLPRRQVSNNKNVGKIVSNNVGIITDTSGYITDDCYEVYNSKFQFSDFGAAGAAWLYRPVPQRELTT